MQMQIWKTQVIKLKIASSFIPVEPSEKDIFFCFLLLVSRTKYDFNKGSGIQTEV